MKFKKLIAFSFLGLISIFPSYGTEDIDQNFNVKEESIALRMKENYENTYNNIITGIKDTQEIVNALYVKFQMWNSEECGVTFSLPPDEKYLPDDYFQYAINVLELKKKKISIYYETFDQVDQFPKNYPEELNLYNNFIKISSASPQQFLTLVKKNIGKLEALFQFLDLYKPYVNKMIQTADMLLCIYKNDEQIQINFDNKKGSWEKTQFYLNLEHKNYDPFSFHLDNVKYISDAYIRLKNDIEVLRTNINNSLIYLKIQLPQTKKMEEKIEEEKNQTNESQLVQKNKEKKKRKRKNKKNKIKSIESVKQEIQPEAPTEQSKNTIISELQVPPSNQTSSSILQRL